MNSTEIFSLALGLESSWKIEKVEMKLTENSIKELHLHIGHTQGYQFKDKDEKTLSSLRYQRQEMEAYEFFGYVTVKC